MLSQPPGSGPDNVARILSDRLAKAWGQAVVIENKPGGQNVIGAQVAARSALHFSAWLATMPASVTMPARTLAATVAARTLGSQRSSAITSCCRRASVFKASLPSGVVMP